MVGEREKVLDWSGGARWPHASLRKIKLRYAAVDYADYDWRGALSTWEKSPEGWQRTEVLFGEDIREALRKLPPSETYGDDFM